MSSIEPVPVEHRLSRTPRRSRAIAGRFIGAAMRLVPRRLRFGVALRTARVLSILLRRSANVRRQEERFRMETAYEVVSKRVFDVMSRYGCPFDPRIRRVDGELMEAALARGRGVLIAGSHAMLNNFGMRALFDRGIEPHYVGPPGMVIPGTDAIAPGIEPSFTLLHDVRDRLSSGKVVTAFLDGTRPSEKTRITVETVRGPIVFADALLRLAVRLEIPVVFIATRIIDGEIVISHGAVEAGDERSVEKMTAAYAEFIRRHVAAVWSRS